MGVPVEVEDKDTFYAILQSKYIFEREIRKVEVDTSVVNLTLIELEERRVENPQPYVITI